MIIKPLSPNGVGQNARHTAFHAVLAHWTPLNANGGALYVLCGCEFPRKACISRGE